jgi:hypothetical protein
MIARRAALAAPDVARGIADMGRTPLEFHARIRTETERWRGALARAR